jgi:hypothetical protein
MEGLHHRVYRAFIDFLEVLRGVELNGVAVEGCELALQCVASAGGMLF